VWLRYDWLLFLQELRRNAAADHLVGSTGRIRLQYTAVSIQKRVKGDSSQPVRQRIIARCSYLLLLVGVAVFLIGGKFLHEIKHLSFQISETVGIIGRVLLMLFGAGVAIAYESPSGQ